MPAILPVSGRPRLSSTELEKMLEPFNIDRNKYVMIVAGIRGYYRNSMGAPGVNDRGIYDDAIFIHTPSAMAAFNGNTDPSTIRRGKGTGNLKGMACLMPGAWYVHQFGLHKGKYLALCQRLGNVEVKRDGTPDYIDTGNFGINIHKGSYNGTSSLGCQTVHPDQWNAFISMAVDQAKRYYGASRWNKVCVPYVLMEE